MLQAVASRIPHMILATATPMQKDVEEYHSILKLLGLPKIWQKKRAYLESLKIISQGEAPSAPDAYSAANLLMKTIKDNVKAERILLVVQASYSGATDLAGGGKAEVAVRQRIGRGLRRKKAGPNICYVVMFQDSWNNHTNSHSLECKRIILDTPGFVDGIVEDFDMAADGFKAA